MKQRLTPVPVTDSDRGTGFGLTEQFHGLSREIGADSHRTEPRGGPTGPFKKRAVGARASRWLLAVLGHTSPMRGNYGTGRLLRWAVRLISDCVGRSRGQGALAFDKKSVRQASLHNKARLTRPEVVLRLLDHLEAHRRVKVTCRRIGGMDG